ncbi:MAG: J domain-containing protein [Tissierellaceae bacterium]|nr:J domain-containing protein [Tissierellaceae bacterium]
MNALNKFWGTIINGIAKFLSVLFDIVISITEGIVLFVRYIGRGLYGIISMGGCLIFFIFGPFALTLLFNPAIMTFILLLVIIPILGTKFVSLLKYVKYMITEYLFDKADNLIHGRKARFDSFSGYGNKYKRMEQEKLRKEQQQRQQEQQRQWEERFRQWNEQQRTYQGGWYDYGNGNYNTGGQTYANPNIEFKKKYEESCDLLGVGYDADKYQIKLAYRKKAKEYHPDLNKAANATQMFQKINDAYEFLSDSNIERYKTM